MLHREGTFLQIVNNECFKFDLNCYSGSAGDVINLPTVREVCPTTASATLKIENSSWHAHCTQRVSKENNYR